MSHFGYVVLLAGLGILTIALFRSWLRLRREEFIRNYRWPAGLLERLEKQHAGFERKDSALVSRGLRQFFVAYLRSGTRFVSMPSQVADDLWHEFILLHARIPDLLPQGVWRLPASHAGCRPEREQEGQ